MKKPVRTPVNHTWQPACHVDDLIMHAGVAVRAHGEQVALFLTDQGLFGVDNVDPFCGAAVLSRGIVGDLGGRLVVASPMYKQHFCLETGRCLEDGDVRIRTWPLRKTDSGIVQVGLPAVDICKESDHAIAASL
ncbi:MAG TPA: nitrite reductase small subunit NirD [Burkholderiaceae bacterium]|nr:nitrite reductase small subunit NirD [Burkholderiaceae bacterium]